MKIKNILENKEYNIKLNIKSLTVNIEFDIENNETSRVDGDALYYLICALSKYENRDIKEIDVITKIQIINRLDMCKDKIEELKRGFNDYI